MAGSINQIFNYLKSNRQIDPSVYRVDFVTELLENRMAQVQCGSLLQYLAYLKMNTAEMDRLIDGLSVNVSHFFRNPLVFDYIENKVLPVIVHKKLETKERSLRVWSAGCATGEEPYSIAIIHEEYLEKHQLDLDVYVCATDVDEDALCKAGVGEYARESLADVKFSLVEKYFGHYGRQYRISPKIKKRVSFSTYNLMDQKSYVPRESIFGHFDMVLCRNVLIYFDQGHQKFLFEKLYRAITDGGYLILGESEAPPPGFSRAFMRCCFCCNVYQKK